MFVFAFGSGVEYEFGVEFDVVAFDFNAGFACEHNLGFDVVFV